MPYISFSKRKIFVVLILFLLLLGITLSVIFINQKQDIRQHAAGETWQEVGIHPQAVNQPTVGYKTLSALIGWNRKIYSGYGNDHMGPISLEAFNPLDRTFTEEHIAYTESATHFRTQFGKLYLPTRNGIHEVQLDSFSIAELV